MAKINETILRKIVREEVAKLNEADATITPVEPSNKPEYIEYLGALIDTINSARILPSSYGTGKHKLTEIKAEIKDGGYGYNLGNILDFPYKKLCITAVIKISKPFKPSVLQKVPLVIAYDGEVYRAPVRKEFSEPLTKKVADLLGFEIGG